MENTFEIKLLDKTYTCRTSFASIQAFEEKAGISIIEAWEQMSSNKIKFHVIACGVWSAINGERVFNGDKPLIFETVGEMVHQHGFMDCSLYVLEFFKRAFPSSGTSKAEDTEKKSIE